jgi:hypothetical protein
MFASLVGEVPKREEQDDEDIIPLDTHITPVITIQRAN